MAAVAALAGRLEDASAPLAEALTLAGASPAPDVRALTLLAMAQLFAIHGDRDNAQSLIVKMQTSATSLGAQPLLARAEILSRSLGLTAREVEAVV